MLSYFSEQLSDQASRGVENRVEQVELLKGDVEEAWREDGFEYVTARLLFKAVDYTVRSGTGQVVEGDANRPAEATEVWTFVRSQGGRWLLSAIQQA
jgi:predicted lipid-binding transport protein (Tim44 family)